MSVLSKLSKEKKDSIMEKRFDLLLSRYAVEKNSFKKTHIEKDWEYILDKWSTL